MTSLAGDPPSRSDTLYSPPAPSIEVIGPKNGGHATLTDLFQQPVAALQGGVQARDEVSHRRNSLRGVRIPIVPVARFSRPECCSILLCVSKPYGGLGGKNLAE